MTAVPRVRASSDAPALTEACQVGFSGAGSYVVNYIFPPNDAYYTLIRTQDCSSCPGSSHWATNDLSLSLSYPVACSIPVRIAIVAAKGGPDCWLPDTSRVIGGSQDTVLTSLGGVTTFDLRFHAYCRLDSFAFLVVTFKSDGLGCATSGTRPRWVVGGTCAPCQSYNYYPGGGDDLCAVAFPGNPIMGTTIDGDGCNAVAVGDAAPLGGGLRILAITPNPNPRGLLRLTLASATDGETRIEVFDLLGRRRIMRIIRQSPGPSIVAIDEARELDPGVYLARITQGDFTASARFVMTR